MEVPSEMLLHPELLSNEQLQYIIEQRKLKMPCIERMCRDELLELFHDYCVPHGQRKYRDSGRGKMLNKTRNISSEPEPKFTAMEVDFKKTTLSLNDRLKPPPDLLSGHMKRIKLDNVTSPVNNSQNLSIKRKNTVTPASDGPPKKQKKPITWP